MGAKIKGAGSSKIEINGVKKLKDASYNIMPDRIETGTFLCLAAMNRADLVIENLDEKHIIPIIDKLEEMGCKLNIEKYRIKINTPRKLNAVDIKTMPYPGFPTDMQSIFSTILTTAKGTSIVVENIFENRFKYIQELIRMGAKITVQGKSAVFEGVNELVAAPVYASDLRAGAALIIAGIIAKGKTEIYNLNHIDRGYENIEEKFRKLGAKIERVEE